MKYLLKIVLLTILFIPMALVDLFRAAWIFDSTEIKKFWGSYKRIVKQNYYHAFGIKRPSRF